MGKHSESKVWTVTDDNEGRQRQLFTAATAVMGGNTCSEQCNSGQHQQRATSHQLKTGRHKWSPTLVSKTRKYLSATAAMCDVLQQLLASVAAMTSDSRNERKQQGIAMMGTAAIGERCTQRMNGNSIIDDCLVSLWLARAPWKCLGYLKSSRQVRLKLKLWTEQI